MELRYLNALRAVAREGSFSSAADELGTVQSNISDHVRQLERELGVTLLNRQRKGVTPTEFGDVVIERARRINRELQTMSEEIEALRGLEIGQASLGVVGTLSRLLVPEFVTEYKKRGPGVTFRILEGVSERLWSEVIAQNIAQAIVGEPVSDRRLIIEPLFEEDLVAVLAPDAKIGTKELSISRLLDFPLILPPDGNPLRAEVDKAAREADLQIQVKIEVEGIRLLGDLVSAGLGVSVLPVSVAQSYEHVRSVRIRGMPPRQVALVRSRDADLSGADSALADVIKLVVGKMFGKSRRRRA